MTTTERPPIKFAEPGRICRVVTPPSSAASKPGSCGQIECSAQTLEVTGLVASLPSSSPLTRGLAYTPKCEWISMIPGVTHLPRASTMRASAGAVSALPTAWTRPSDDQHIGAIETFAGPREHGGALDEQRRIDGHLVGRREGLSSQGSRNDERREKSSATRDNIFIVRNPICCPPPRSEARSAIIVCWPSSRPSAHAESLQSMSLRSPRT